MKRITGVVTTIVASVMLGLCSCDREHDSAATGGSGATATAGTTESTGRAANTGARATGGVFTETPAGPATRPATQSDR